jgi:Domain of unknown function (DUF397)
MGFPWNGNDRPNWRKSAHSINGGNCAEVSSGAGIIVVRDSQDPHTQVLRYPASSWQTFLDATRRGQFDSLA